MVSRAKDQPDPAQVLLYWLPLGAGAHFVRWNGRLYEALVAFRDRRTMRDLYHAALEVRVGGDRIVVEVTPAWGSRVADRGVVLQGPVGARWLGRFAAFRYEVRRWRGGVIPDLAHAVGGARRVSADAARARRLLDLVPDVPALTWGRDESRTGDMWNSNSLVAWLLARSGHSMAAIGPPGGGRAPGWHAGLVLAAHRTAAAGERTDPRPAIDDRHLAA
jgi:hypothetical protein